MDKISYKVNEIGQIERTIFNLTKEKSIIENDIQELNNKKHGIEDKLSMEIEKRDREYLDLRSLFLSENNK